MNFIIFVLYYLAANHLLIQERNILDTEQKCSKFLLEIMTLMSSVNNMDVEFLLYTKVDYYMYCLLCNKTVYVGQKCNIKTLFDLNHS